MDVERYRVEHETRYAYRVPVSQSWQLAHLTPRELPWQRVRRARAADRAGAPTSGARTRDAFGNGVTHFARARAASAAARAHALRRSRSASGPTRPAAEPIAWEAVRDAVRGEPAQDDLRAGAAERAERARALVGRGARLCGAELRRRPRLARGDRPT